MDPIKNKKEFISFAQRVTLWVGHNIIGFDYWVCNLLLHPKLIAVSHCVDTLIVSRLLNYKEEGGHSLDNHGKRLGHLKGKFKDFSKYSQEMLDYCIQDTLVTRELFLEQEKYIYSPIWKQSLRLEHDVAEICNQIHNNGFAFDVTTATSLHDSLVEELAILEKEIKDCFPPRTSLVRVITPKATKFGTISKVDFRSEEDLSPYQVGASFSRFKWVEFNPGSSKQRVERLNEANWKPFNKTDGHIDTERALKDRRLPKAQRYELEEKLKHHQIYGWKTDEDNLGTLPLDAPEGARKLVQWLVLDRRRLTLEEWITAVSGAPRPFKDLYTGRESTEPRIHGRILHIGAWTHRRSHANPNTANISTFHGLPKDRPPTPVELVKARIDPLLRSFWRAGTGRILVGVDAESIQLRVLAHYMDDPRFTESLLTGDKKLGTDPHSLNKKALGDVCRSRNEAKTFIYAFLLGAGVGKVMQILECDKGEASQAIENFVDFYPGLKYLRESIIPLDWDRGYFEGFDGRLVSIPDERRVLAGYLQCGESVIMKKAQTIWVDELTKEKTPFWIVNDVHDEWQTETVDDMDTAIHVAQVQAEAIKTAGEHFKLRCPFAGSYKNDDGAYTIGYNWSVTH